MLNFNQIQDFFIVLMAVFGFVATIDKIVKIFKNWHKESPTTRHDKQLEDHEKRIGKLESKTKEQEDFIHVLCNSLFAMISHSINGNSIEELKKAKKELENFLINK